MVAPDAPVLFVHVMKTSGTTFLEQLLHCHGRDRVWPQSHSATAGDEFGRYGIPAVLLAVPPRQLRRLAVIAGHVPAVTAEVLSDRLGVHVPSVTLLREPVARVVSHVKQFRSETGLTGSLEEVYDDLRAREPFFVDHQTKAFAARAEDLTTVSPDSELGRLMAERRAAIDAVLAERRGGSPEALAAALAEVMPDDWDAERIHWGMNTAPPWWVPIDEGRFGEAVDRLDAVAVVGVAERHDAFVAAVGERFGWALRPIGARRVSGDDEEVPNSLRRRILADSAHDVALYEHALGRAP